MKKTLLYSTIVASVLFGGMNLQAATSQSPMQAPGDSQDYIIFGYCEDYGKYFGPDLAGIKVQTAIEIPEEQAQILAGNSITGLRIAFGPSSVQDVNIFLAYELEDDVVPFNSQVSHLSVTEGWNQVTLETPYEIEGKRFFIGYWLTTANSKDYPVIADGIPPTHHYGDYINNGKGWTNKGDFYGNMCIEAIIEGDNLPQNDVKASSLSVSDYVKTDSPFSLSVKLTNKGAKAVESVEAGCFINNVKAEGITYKLVPESINPGYSGNLVISGVTCDTEMLDVPVSVVITKVNGEDDFTPDNNTASSSFSALEVLYEPTMVVEEGTGTWCKWCVRGIVAFSDMKEKYGDSFIGIAIHHNDAMTLLDTPYNLFIRKQVVQFPGGVINRRFKTQMYPEEIEDYYLSIMETPSIAEITIDSAEYDGWDAENISVTTTSHFAIDAENNPYRIAFAITENGIGPYLQQNAYAGGKAGEMDGWENLDEYVETIFNDVQVGLSDPYGDAGSLPAQITKQTDYTYSTSLSTSFVKNLENCEVIALIINTKTSAIENACKITPTNIGEAGIETAETQKIALKSVNGGIQISGNYKECKVYGIDGSNVKTVYGEASVSLPNGIFIVKVTGSNNSTVTKKIIVR